MQANKRRHPKAKPRKRFWSFIRKLVLWCLVMAAIGAAVGYFGFMMAWKRYDNWAAEFDLERINDLEKPSIIYDRNGEEIGRIYVENRSYVTLDKISPAMINALIAQEDSRFREHPGYDFLWILLRCAVRCGTMCARALLWRAAAPSPSSLPEMRMT